MRNDGGSLLELGFAGLREVRPTAAELGCFGVGVEADALHGGFKASRPVVVGLRARFVASSIGVVAPSAPWPRSAVAESR